MGLQWARSLAIFFAMISSAPLVMGTLGYNPDRVLLKDVTAVTLHEGMMTSGRRSAPVPQLECVGGTAKGYFTPKMVQCYNMGFDGYDVQWECKAEMDNAFKFGSVEVACEGYDYPDDPYILRGSCGLEYTLDFTEEGYKRYNQKQSREYSHRADSSHFTSDHKSSAKHESKFGDLLFLLAILIYITFKFVKKKCEGACQPQTETGYSQQRSSQSSSEEHNNFSRAQPSAPPAPPYGFRPDIVHGTENSSTSSTPDRKASPASYSPPPETDSNCEPPPSYESCVENMDTTSHACTHNPAEKTPAAGGFFEHLRARSQHHQQQQQQVNQQQSQQQQQQQHSQQQQRSYHGSSGWSWNWGSQSTSSQPVSHSCSSGGGSSASRSTAPSISGKRVASGFGGTKRR